VYPGSVKKLGSYKVQSTIFAKENRKEKGKGVTVVLAVGDVEKKISLSISRARHQPERKSTPRTGTRPVIISDSFA
jgi:predicted RNA-binding protein with RPS1 domain